MSIPRALRVLAIAAPLVGAGAAALHLAHQFPSGSVEALVMLSIATQIVLVIAAICGASVSPAPLTDRLGLQRGRLGWGALLLLGVGMLALSHALDGVLQLSHLRETSALAELGEQVASARGNALTMALLGLAVVPGFAEELLCRGFLQRGLREIWNPTLSIGGAALFFGMLHLEPVHATVATALGLYLGLAAHWSDSTRTAIGLHVVNNLTSVMLMIAPRQPDAPLALTVPLAFLLCAGCLWRVRGSVARSRAAKPHRDLPEGSDDALGRNDSGTFHP